MDRSEREKPTKTTDITTEEVFCRMYLRPVLIDTRSKEDYTERTIVGAMNAPQAAWTATVATDIWNRMRVGDKDLVRRFGISAPSVRPIAVIFNANGESRDDAEPFAERIRKWDPSIQVVWLQGGYEQFAREFPFLCVTDPFAGEDQILPVYPCRVTPHVYLGCAKSSKDATVLKNLNIRAIVNAAICENFQNHFSADGEDPALGYHMTYKSVYLDDRATENAMVHFKGVTEFIESHVSRGENVLVHCAYGYSRSPTMVAAYLMTTQGLTAEQALDKVKTHREVIGPNPGFCKQLTEYETVLASPEDAQSGSRKRAKK